MVLKKLEKIKNVGDFIEGGGQVLSEKQVGNQLEWTNFTLRIRKDLSYEIDKTIQKRIGISKTAWILEAIQEKLKMDNE